MRRALVIFAPVAIAAACGAEHYVYSARKLDPDAGCLDPYQSIDLVNGDSVGSKCAPNCFRYGGATFTSTVCPPLPELATALDAEAPECKAAVALYDKTCGAETDAAVDARDAGDAGDDHLEAGTDVLDAGDSGE